MINRSLAVVFLVAIALSAPGFSSSAEATSIPGYPDEGHWFHGPTDSMEHWGSGPESLLLYGDGAGLVIADVMTPGAMTVLGEVNTGYVVECIDIADDGQIAAVCDREKWITLVDISNRAAPTVLGRYEVEDGRSPYGVAFGTGYLYAAIGPAGLWVIDISNPALPELEGAYIEPGTDFVFDVEVLGNHAFLADDNDGVTAIDVSDPTNPTYADRFTAAFDASHITIDGNTAYVSKRGFGMHIIDLSAAPTMTELGTFVLPGGGIIYRTEVVAPGWVVCADGINGLLVVDVSNPATPSMENTFAQDMFTVATDGTAAFAAQPSYYSNPTLFALDVDIAAPIDPPAHVGSLPLLDDNVGVAVSGSTVLIANENGGAFMVDATDPTNPQTTSEIDLGSRGIQSLDLVGSTLAFGSFGTDLGLVDVSNPAAPVVLPEYVMPGAGYASDVVGLPGTQAVVVGAGPEGVYLINLSNPLAPTVIGSWTPASGAVLHVDPDAGRIAAGGSGDVWVVDATIPSTPVEYTAFTVTGTVLDVAMSGSHVFVATGTNGVRIVDVSNPVSPTEVAVFSTSPTSANGVFVHDDTMYVAADRFWGMFVVDVSNPAAPNQLQVVDTPGSAEKVAVSGDLVALADGAGGVRIWGTAQDPLIFADGFESGDTTAWTFATP